MSAYGMRIIDWSSDVCSSDLITNVMILGPVSAFLAYRPFLFAPSIKIDPLIEWIRERRIGQVAFVPTMIYDLLQADLDLPDHFRMSSGGAPLRSEEHTSELQSLMRISYAVFCLQKKNINTHTSTTLQR